MSDQISTDDVVVGNLVESWEAHRDTRRIHAVRQDPGEPVRGDLSDTVTLNVTVHLSRTTAAGLAQAHALATSLGIGDDADVKVQAGSVRYVQQTTTTVA